MSGASIWSGGLARPASLVRLRSTGAIETGKILQLLAPSANFSTTFISDGTDIIRPATLRGLGPDQTLLLVNGKRRHRAAVIAFLTQSIGESTQRVPLSATSGGAMDASNLLKPALQAGTLRCIGSTTYKDPRKGEGTEPDECVYVSQPERILGKDWITLGVDPTPEIMIEIDVSHGSESKRAIYENHGVPELWHYSKRRTRIFELTPQGYKETDRSRYFPLLTSDQLTKFMNLSLQEGQSKTLKAFREWLRSSMRKDDD